MKKEQYITALAIEPRLLDVKVNDLIKEGYMPLGAPYVWQSYVCQALVKTNEKTRLKGMSGDGIMEAKKQKTVRS